MINPEPDNKSNSKNNRLYEQRVYGTEKQKQAQYDKFLGKTEIRSSRNTPEKRADSHGEIIAIMAVFMVLIFGSLIYLLFSGEKDGKNGRNGTPSVTESPTMGPTNEPERIYESLCVVLSVDPEIKTIRFYDVNEEIEKSLVYTGSSLFYAEQGSQVTAAQLTVGDLMRVTLDSRQIIKKAEWSKETWEKLRIDNLNIDRENHRMEIRGQFYKYSDDLCVINNEKRIGLDEILTSEDKLTIRGVGDTVCEIIVTVGHGVLQLKNHEDFIDGEITIGSRYTEKIPLSGMFVVREGEYKVTVSAGKFEGSETVTVRRGEETVLDVYQYGRGSITVGEVTFRIEPAGATLLINGEETDYEDGPVELDYASYFMEIRADGYETQKTTLSVDTPTKSVSFFLTELEPSPTPEPTDLPEPTPVPTPEGTEPGGNEEPKPPADVSGSTMYDISAYGFAIDPEHRVYILGPEGAEIILTNLDIGSTCVLGNAPCDFQKVIGTMQIIVMYQGREVMFNYEEFDDDTDCICDYSDNENFR